MDRGSPRSKGIYPKFSWKINGNLRFFRKFSLIMRIFISRSQYGLCKLNGFVKILSNLKGEILRVCAKRQLRIEIFEKEFFGFTQENLIENWFLSDFLENLPFYTALENKTYNIFFRFRGIFPLPPADAPDLNSRTTTSAVLCLTHVRNTASPEFPIWLEPPIVVGMMFLLATSGWRHESPIWIYEDWLCLSFW